MRPLMEPRSAARRRAAWSGSAGRGRGRRPGCRAGQRGDGEAPGRAGRSVRARGRCHLRDRDARIRSGGVTAAGGQRQDSCEKSHSTAGPHQSIRRRDHRHSLHNAARGEKASANASRRLHEQLVRIAPHPAVARLVRRENGGCAVWRLCRVASRTGRLERREWWRQGRLPLGGSRRMLAPGLCRRHLQRASPRSGSAAVAPLRPETGQMVPRKGFEPLTHCLEGSRSIH